MTKTFRTISKDKYIVAGIITFLIFALGLTLGFIIEDHRYNLVEEVNLEQDVNYLSLQLQYIYLTSFSTQDNCPILDTTLKSAVKDLSDSLSEVIAFEEEKDISETRRKSTTRRYVLDNLRYWLLARESQQRCQLDIVPILYFYATECPSCPNQGTILSYFKNLFGEKVLVFPINLDLLYEEPMIEIVVKQFEVKKYPTIIINDKKYEGVVRKDKLQALICESLQEGEHCS